LAEQNQEGLSMAEEIAILRKEVARLLQENSELKERSAETDSSKLVEVNHRLMQQVADLEKRNQKLEKENLDFANLCVQVQEQSEAITNLYVAGQRLHTTVDPEEVMKIIFEILAELVGAEQFGIFMLDEKNSKLELMAAEGIEGRLPSKTLPAGEGLVGEVASSGEPFYYEPRGDSEMEARLPLAAVPLNMNGQAVGVIVIYKLLNQKPKFSSVDHQLLQLLAADAATSLATARLHNTMDRKLKTIEGFVQLMKS
jgi:nitrate/nitrite-specific signal transduction histidine kinase